MVAHLKALYLEISSPQHCLIMSQRDESTCYRKSQEYGTAYQIEDGPIFEFK